MIDDQWSERNKRYLSSALQGVREILEGRAGDAEEQRTALMDGMTPPPPLEHVCALFGLSSFERLVLILCAGFELDSAFAELCAAVHGDARQPYPTFSLALAKLPGAHWSALSPRAPLRYRSLVELVASDRVTTSPLKIDERVLHYTLGIDNLDERLAGIVEPLATTGGLPPSHQAIADAIHATWLGRPLGTRETPVIGLSAEDDNASRAIAAAACANLGLAVCVMSAGMLPTTPGELDALVRLWDRESMLSGSALLVETDDVEPVDRPRRVAITRFVERSTAPLLLAGRERALAPRRMVVPFEVQRPTRSEQRSLWGDALADHDYMDRDLDAIVAQFNLSGATIQAVSLESRASEVNGPADAAAWRLWDACRRQARPRLDDLAQHIEPVAEWDDLVLPDAQKSVLREIATQVRQRTTVYDTWGFAARSPRGLGISALFAGASGTGKTLAAEVLAADLRLDLYRIDLSQVVSKYIGETEKNLGRIFAAAEDGGAILLFDEADALFGRRSEVKDSHDRYANIEVSYLLQRMEAYRGLAILTTNMKDALDPAFLRRIRFVVQFPFPEPPERAEIWRRVFPSAVPTADLDHLRLARLNVAGGNIRNIALNAAFLAADLEEPVRMTHLLSAARGEYAKLEKALTDAELVGWP